ncbi:hypothetical protein RB195_014894 [Necator americanus]|uniref:Uncharacterized protein n=1 Tax=Necator americanus TaxID=51031 RepID=A0ABR1E3T5_NECAM
MMEFFHTFELFPDDDDRTDDVPPSIDRTPCDRRIPQLLGAEFDPIALRQTGGGHFVEVEIASLNRLGQFCAILADTESSPSFYKFRKQLLWLSHLD